MSGLTEFERNQSIIRGADPKNKKRLSSSQVGNSQRLTYINEKNDALNITTTAFGVGRNSL